jgi:hypothetical protein
MKRCVVRRLNKSELRAIALIHTGIAFLLARERDCGQMLQIKR